MHEISYYFYSSLPFVAVVLSCLLIVMAAGVGMVRPRYLAYAYLLVLFFFNSTSYGSLSVISSPGIYARGSGLLLFPLLLWTMLACWCCARMSAGYQRLPPPPCTLRPWFLGWCLLLAAHLAAGLLADVRLRDILAVSGFSNIVWMAPLVSLLLLAFRHREDAVVLSHLILLAGLGRALFGLVRWAAFGGDPNNVYANMNAIAIKLTFFDINDSLLCALAFATAAVRLFQAGQEPRAARWRLAEWTTLGASAACIVLSYRRSAWIGLVLTALVVLPRLAPQRRLQLIALGVPAVGAGLLVAAIRRLGQTRGAGEGLAGLLFDFRSQRFGAESERVLELKLALADFLAHPLTGIGSWGRYSGYRHIAWQANPDGGLFLHSGVLHIALKAGVPGLVLLGGTIWAFCAFARQALRRAPPGTLALATAGAAGLAFMLPDLLLGTPFPQVRTTQMLAVCLALPYVAMAGGIRAAQPAPPPGQRPGTSMPSAAALR